MKKLLAIILAAVMVAAMLPAGIVSAADSMATYTYVFSGAAHKVSADAQAADSNAMTSTNRLLIDDTIASESAPWGVSTVGVKNDYNTKSNAFNNRWDAIYMRVADNNVNSLVSGYAPRGYIEIDVATSGTFVPTLDAFYPSCGSRKDSKGRYWELYLVPATTEGFQDNFTTNAPAASAAIFKNENRIGVIDSSASGANCYEFAATYLAAGRYYLCLVASDLTPGSTINVEGTGHFDMSLKSLVLAQVPDASAVNKEYDYDFSTAAIKSSVLGEATSFVLAPDGAISDDALTTLSSYDFIDTTASQKWSLVKRAKNNVLGSWFSGFGTHYWVSSSALTADGFNFYAEQFGQRIDSNASNPYFVLKVEVPNAGTYDLSVDNAAMGIGVDVDMNVFAIPASGATVDSSFAANYMVTKANTETTVIPTYHVGTKNVDTGAAGKVGSFEVSIPGTYYIGFNFSGADLTSSNNQKTFTLKGMTLKCTSIPATNAATTAKEAQQNVDPENAEVESLSATGSANVVTYATDLNGDAITIGEDETGILDNISGLNVGENFKVTAPKIDGYTFKFWSLGTGENSRPVTGLKPSHTVKLGKGATKLYAVYAPNDADECVVEFYDATGEKKASYAVAAGETVTAPALPESSLRGTALCWKSPVSYANVELAAGESYTAPENVPLVAFVAQYSTEASALKDVTVSVAGTEGATGAGSYKFGSTATVVAPARENGKGTKVFAYWTRNGEIVSFDKSYSFTATNDITVTAVYQDYAPASKTIRKIIVDKVTVGTNEEVYADFIGCGNAIERGFIFGGTDFSTATHRLPMTTSKSTFSVIDDIGEATAYAIFEDGVIYGK